MTYLDADTIRDLGILQELNRIFLHPLGLAAEVDLDTGALRLQDHRANPEGVVYGPDVLSLEKAVAFFHFRQNRHSDRERHLGFIYQPGPLLHTPPVPKLPSPT